MLVVQHRYLASIFRVNRQLVGASSFIILLMLTQACAWGASGDWSKPYAKGQTKRVEVFEFTQEPRVKYLGDDQFKIDFTVKGFCDVTISICDAKGRIVRHLASGVLGSNAPAPFQKNSLKQVVLWDGKNDLGLYPKSPEKLNVHVSLGLKPTVERVLGWSPYDTKAWDINNQYRSYRLIEPAPEGVYVMSSSNAQIRLYDHDAKYIKTVFPPSGKMPLDKNIGQVAIEYEPGRRALQGTPGGEGDVYAAGTVNLFSPAIPLAQHARIHKGKLVYVAGGHRGPMTVHRFDLKTGTYVDQDRTWSIPTQSASKELDRMGFIQYLKLAMAPDGGRIYVSGLYHAWYKSASYAVHKIDTKKVDHDTTFVGDRKTPGQSENRFMRPEGIDVDAKGRVYVCDLLGHHIRIFSPSGKEKHLKSIKIRYPYLVRVDQKRGGIYVFHVKGSGKDGNFFLSRLKSFEDPRVVAEVEIGPINMAYIGQSNLFGRYSSEVLMSLDSWAPHPRIWVQNNPVNIKVIEFRDGKFNELLDFSKATRKAGLMPHMMTAGHWKNVGPSRICVDPTREQVYVFGITPDHMRFDLKTGAHKKAKFPVASFHVDRNFDARGYVSSHLLRCITRHDPGDGFREVPFDYGVEGGEDAVTGTPECKGLIPTKTQGVYGNRDGFGVNARGDMAAVCTIGYIPRFENDAGIGRFMGDSGDKYHNPYTDWKNKIAASLKRGDSIYHVKRWEGRYLAGGTIWTYDRTGELRNEDIIPGLGLVAGIQIDMDGNLYTAFDKTLMVGKKPFLQGRGSIIGNPKAKLQRPKTGTLFKTSSKGAKVYCLDAQIPMTAKPKRPMEVNGGWINGAEWLYGGVGPVKDSSKFSIDWYRRSFVPENYRHSVGVLDTNGNLVTHIGRYGNADSGRGLSGNGKAGEVTFGQVFYAAATSNYLCVSDAGNDRIVVVKLGYHTERKVPILMK